MADASTVTLLLMFFTAAPGDVSSKIDKTTAEQTVAWALQSTQRVEVADANTCSLYADQINRLISPVNTMTVRAYCLCPYSQQYKDRETGKMVDLCLNTHEQLSEVKKLKGKETNPGIELVLPGLNRRDNNSKTSEEELQERLKTLQSRPKTLQFQRPLLPSEREKN